MGIISQRVSLRANKGAKMDITGTTFNFSKTVVTEEERLASPEKPVDGDKEKKPKASGDKNKSGDDKKSSVGAFAYDMIKTGVQQTVGAVLSNVSGSPTLQVQLNAAQQIGGKAIAYTMAIATQNWVALGAMAISDVVSYASKQAEFKREKAWSDYDLDQYRERRGYSNLRNRR